MTALVEIRQELPVRSYTVSVYLIRDVSHDPRVLLLRRAGPVLHGEWFNVTGRIEPGERAWQAAFREIDEETGLVTDRLYSADLCEQYYDAVLDCISISPVFVAFVDDDQEPALNQEHSEYRWMTFVEADQVVPFSGQRATLALIQREFVTRVPPKLQRIVTGG